MTLTAGELAALRNLSLKKLGQPVGWITISDARALTALGLAVRNQGGWQITAQGETALNAADLESGARGNTGNLVIMTPGRPTHPSA